MHLRDVLADKKVIICGGSGGVGKTTLSAALGMALARQGKRCVVITIDPAQRLADALGIAMEGGKIVPVPLESEGPGTLHAMMLRPDQAVDSFMQKLMHTTDPAHPLVSERFFQQGLAMLAASPEYLAVQELYDLSLRPEFDVIVLDTPPTRQSIDFLTAPNRLARALEEKSLVLGLVRPYLRANRVGFNLIKAGAQAILKLVDKIFGFQAFVEFFTFFETCVNLLDLDRLEERIKKVTSLLQDSTTTFLVVAAPNPMSVEEALYFHRKIATWQIAFGGFVINRVQPDVGCDHATWQHLVDMESPMLASGAQALPDIGTLSTLLPKLLSNLGESILLRQAQQREIGLLAGVLREGEGLTQVPRLDQDVHDLRGIALIADELQLEPVRSAEPAPTSGPSDR